MVDATHKSFDASDRSYYAIIKKEAHNLAAAAGFGPKRLAELDIIVAEMTSNLHKYSKDGELLLSLPSSPDTGFIEVISIDNGPGMSDAARMTGDGISTGNSMGHGLGSIKRFSDQFDIYSQKGWGTVILSRVYREPPAAPRSGRNLVVRPIVVAKPGESTSGDGYYLKAGADYTRLILADGLGHGPEANHAINEAVNAFRQCGESSPVEIIRYLHSSVRKTRGLVATIAVYDLKQQVLRLAGVGNIACRLSGPSFNKNHLAYNGIIGHNIPNTMNDQVLSLADYTQLTLCSDGIRSRWELGKHPGLLRCDPSLQAAAIYKDFARRSDDMSVVIAKI